MAKNKFDYKGALAEGYTPEEISAFLIEQHPKFDVEGARKEGYNDTDIIEFLSDYEAPKAKKESRSPLEKAGRVGAQFGLGLAEKAAFPYEVASMPLASKEAQQVPYRENLASDIESLLEQKQAGIWDQSDEDLYNHLVKQLESPSESEKYIKTEDVGIRGLAEKATGVDLTPEGVLEKGANWLGFLYSPKTILPSGSSAKDIIKNILPKGSDLARSTGAGIGMQMAEAGDWGPIGTISASIVGDLMGAGVGGIAKVALSPKKYLSKAFANTVKKDALESQKEIIKEFRDLGIQPDLGTITDSDLVKSIQSKLSQSGLVGKELDAFRNNLTNEIKSEYKSIADQLGAQKFETLHEAGQVGKDAIKKIRDADKSRIGEIYESARSRINEKAKVVPLKLAEKVEEIQAKLAPGKVKSKEQREVLSILKDMGEDLIDADRRVRPVNVNELMNMKIALNDIINYEVQGGQKQLLKGIQKDIDDAILSYGKKDFNFAKDYIRANKEFEKHAKTFRNPNIDRILTSEDPMILINKMNSVQGLKDLERSLGKTAEGKEVFNELKRLKFDQMVGNKMVNNLSDQIKMGTFANLLKNPKDAQLVREMIGKESFDHLSKLQKNVGKLAESANKFFNASKSGTTATDTVVMYQMLSGVASLLMGNPWPLGKLGGLFAGTKAISKLMADKKFLRLVEDAILSKSPAKQKAAFDKLLPYAKSFSQAIKDQSQEESLQEE